MAQKSGELYEILCMITDGDPKVTIKNSLQQDGLEAWQALKRADGRRTLAATLRRYKQVGVPCHAKYLTEVKDSLQSGRKLQKGEGVQLPLTIKLASLTETCTPKIRDMIFQNVD